MGQTSVPDRSESILDKLVAFAGNEHQNVEAGDPVDHSYRLGQHGSNPQPALGWQGPLAFARGHAAAPGIDHHFGTRWGSNGDQRVSLRVEVGATAGLLYVYDATWDEYAILGSDLQLAAVQDAFARAPRLGEHVAVDDFAALLPRVSAVRACPELEL